jgi:hypothetical protein
MIKGLCAFVCISLLLVAQCQTFRKIPLENGKASTGRNLEGSSMTKATFLSTFAPTNYAVSVSTSDAFRTAHEVKPEGTVNMVISLSNSAVGFCSNSENLKKIKCEEPYCVKDAEAKNVISNGPFVRLDNGKPFTTELKIGAGENAGWELKNKAAMYSYCSIPSTYVSNAEIFGILGLGADGDAANNFKGDHPLFSIKTDRAGKGELIFGNDASQYDASKKPQVVKTTANWTALTTNITFGTYNKTTYATRLSFDLNVEGMYIDNSGVGLQDALASIKSKLVALKAFSDSTLGPYLYYNGSLDALPDIEIGLEGNQILKISPYAYSRPVANKPGYFEIMLIIANSYSEYDGGKTGTSIYGTVIGRTIMSQYYSIFEAPKDKQQSPTVTLYPTFTAVPSSGNKGGSGLIWIIAIVALGAIGYLVFKNKAASSLKEHLNTKN